MSLMQIPYEDLSAVNRPYLEQLRIRSEEILVSGWYILGNQVAGFEKEFAAVNGSPYCLGVASGLDALILGLDVFGFPKGKKVLVPSNTYIATILAIIRAGLQPVLVEPDPDTWNIDVKGVEAAYDKDCVAILPVHLYGRLCPMEEIMSFARAKGLKVIEDCAQAHFAESDSRMAGTFGDIGAFSFYPTKNLGALGDGGAILCRDEALYQKLKALRNYGSHRKYYNNYQGWNSRLDEMQAGLLSVKLPYRENVIRHKQKLALIYQEELKDLTSLALPQQGHSDHVWHIFNILVADRDQLKVQLLSRGIGTEIHYPVPPHKQEGYKHLFSGAKYPISEHIHRNTLSLPISTCHSESDIRTVASAIKEISSYLK
jgi:dTDP-4-amino-4,6-dideoxygalactose transaminase